MSGLHVSVRVSAGSLAVSEFVMTVGFPWHASTENRPEDSMLRGLWAVDRASRTSRLDARPGSRQCRPRCPPWELTGASWSDRADREDRRGGRYARTIHTRHRVPCACGQRSGASGTGLSVGDLTPEQRGHRRVRFVFDFRHTCPTIPGAAGGRAGAFGRAPGKLLAASSPAFPRFTSNVNRLQTPSEKRKTHEDN